MLLSKHEIDLAGERLRVKRDDTEALTVLSKWRDRHVYPLNLAFNLLKNQANKVGNHAIFGQRLKRAISVIHKLNRFPEMKLSRIQDIGGCRVILNDYNKLQKLCENVQKSKAILNQHKNYIVYPKNDGYRGIHLIYKCTSSKYLECNGLKIELQLRTKLQHAWATTVEIIDSFAKEQLKLGNGSKDWQRFFYLVADEFAKIEGLPLHNNTIQNRLPELALLVKKLRVTENLSGYSIVVSFISEMINKNSCSEFWVIELDLKKGTLGVANFENRQDAQDYYFTLETELINNNNKNVLLVQQSSIVQLKKAYPNYFADALLFIKMLSKILVLK